MGIKAGKHAVERLVDELIVAEFVQIRMTRFGHFHDFHKTLKRWVCGIGGFGRDWINCWRGIFSWCWVFGWRWNFCGRWIFLRSGILGVKG